MTVVSDIETELGETKYTTDQGPTESTWSADMVDGSITAWSDITDLLTLPADFEDLNISLIAGGTMSLYGFDSENTLVILGDLDSVKWCHCFEYADGTDYASGKTEMTPASELRV